MQTSEIELNVADEGEQRSRGHRASVINDVRPTGYVPEVKPVDKKSKIRLFAAGGVGLMFLSALVIGLAVGLTRKDSPPAVNAVSFKPDDWEKVMVGEKTAPPLTKQEAQRVIDVMTYPDTMNSYNVLALCEYAGREFRAKKLAQIGVMGPSAPVGGWKAEDMGRRVANFDPRYPGVVTILDADLAIQMANCTATIKDRDLFFTLALGDLAPLPDTIPNTKNVTVSSVYMNALTECVQEKAQFAYVRAEIDRQLAKYGSGAAPTSDLTGFVTKQARRLLSHFTADDTTAAAGDMEEALADNLRTDQTRGANTRRRGWFKNMVKAIVHSHHSHHRHVPTGRANPSADGTSAATPYKDAKKATMDSYLPMPSAYTDSTNYNWVYGRKPDGSTIGSTQAHITRVGDWHIIAFRGSETGAFGGKSALLDWMANLDAQPTTVTNLGGVHEGWWKAYTAPGGDLRDPSRSVRDWLRVYFSTFQPQKVLITGHSLGGALSGIAFTDMYANYRTTFLPPSYRWVGFAAGDPFTAEGRAQFKNACQSNKNNCVGFINAKDPVPCAAQTKIDIDIVDFHMPAYNFHNAAAGSNVGADFDSQVDRWWFNGAYSTIVNPCPSVIDYLGDLINIFTTGGLEDAYSVGDHSMDKHNWVDST